MKTFSKYYKETSSLLLLLFFIFIACTENSTEPDSYTNDVAGIISDELGNPVPDAIIEAFAEEAEGKAGDQVLAEKVYDRDTCDEDGQFNLKNLPDDLTGIKVRIHHENFKEYIALLKEIIGEGKKSEIKAKIEHNDDCCGLINVYVKNAEDELLGDVEVRLNKGEKKLRKSFTGSDGKLSFENVCPGEYWLRLYKEGYEVVETEVEIVECDTLHLDITLTAIGSENDSCCNGIIYFYAKDSENNPIKEVKVKLWNGSDLLNTKYTNEAGKVIFEDICEGNYQISFMREGYSGQEFNFEMGCNDTVEYVKTMEKAEEDSCCEGILKVYPRDKETNKALTGATVKLWKDGKLLETIVVEEGKAVFDGLCEGKYGVDIIMEGYVDIEFTVEIPCNETVVVEKGLEKDDCCDGILKVYPRDKETNEALTGATVKLWKDGKLLETIVVEEGKAVFDGLCEGKYGMDIIMEGYHDIEFTVEIPCNETVIVEKGLEKEDDCCNGLIKVVVRNKETNEAIKEAIVKLWQNGEKIGLQYTNEKGNVIFDKLCEGKYAISVAVEGYGEFEKAVELGCNDTIAVEAELEPDTDTCCTAIMKLIIKDNETEAAISGAKVLIYADGNVVGDPVSNNDGFAIEENLCAPKNYVVVIKKEGYETKEFEWKFEECKKYQETIRLTPKG